MPILIILAVLGALALLGAYICYRIVFYAPPAKPLAEGEFDLPPDDIYKPHWPQMAAWQTQIRSLPRQEWTVMSHDGLQLWGSYYECRPGAVTELMFHGYRGSAERDLCGGVQRAFALGRNVLIVDQRTAGRSQGRTITFGILEQRDCLTWVDYMIRRDPDVKIILTGISMGAATVLMAAGKPLPENVVGVLADCGYSSAREIICKCAAEMKLPPKLVYPFIRLGALVFGKFDPDADSPLEAVRRCEKPVSFFHRESDGFVPCHMSRAVYEACPAPKRLVTIPGADHGLSYPVDQKTYLREVADFFTENGVPTEVLEENAV